MNKQARADLQKLVLDRIAEAKGILEDVWNDLEFIKDEEQEKFDNLSEGLQASEMGQRLEESASSLDNAYSELESAMDGLDQAVGEIEGAME